MCTFKCKFPFLRNALSCAKALRRSSPPRLTYPQIKTLLHDLRGHAVSQLGVKIAAMRVAVITYTDISKSNSSAQHARVVSDFSGDEAHIRQCLDGLSCGGGGDAPEDPISALQLAEDLSWTSEKHRTRVLLLFTDSPQHGEQWNPHPDALKGCTWHDDFPTHNASEELAQDTLYALCSKKISLAFICMRSAQTNSYLSLNMAEQWEALCKGFAVKKVVTIAKCGEMTPDIFLRQCISAVTVSLVHPKYGSASITRQASVTRSVAEGKASGPSADAAFSTAIALKRRSAKMATIAEDAAAELAIVEHDEGASAEKRQAAAKRRRALDRIAEEAHKTTHSTSRVEGRCSDAADSGSEARLAPVDKAMSAMESNLDELDARLDSSAHDV